MHCAQAHGVRRHETHGPADQARPAGRPVRATFLRLLSSGPVTTRLAPPASPGLPSPCREPLGSSFPFLFLFTHLRSFLKFCPLIKHKTNSITFLPESYCVQHLLLLLNSPLVSLSVFYELENEGCSEERHVPIRTGLRPKPTRGSQRAALPGFSPGSGGPCHPG